MSWQLTTDSWQRRQDEQPTTAMAAVTVVSGLTPTHAKIVLCKDYTLNILDRFTVIILRRQSACLNAFLGISLWRNAHSRTPMSATTVTLLATIINIWKSVNIWRRETQWYHKTYLHSYPYTNVYISRGWELSHHQSIIHFIHTPQMRSLSVIALKSSHTHAETFNSWIRNILGVLGSFSFDAHKKCHIACLSLYLTGTEQP